MIYGDGVADKLRKRLIARLRKTGKTGGETQSFLHYINLLQIAREELAKFEPIFAQVIHDSQLAAWVRGLEVITKNTSAKLLKAIRNYTVGGVVSGMLFGGIEITEDEIPSFVLTSGQIAKSKKPLFEFPAIAARVASLINKGVVRKPDFEQLSTSMAQRAFTVAHVNSKKKLLLPRG